MTLVVILVVNFFVLWNMFCTLKTIFLLSFLADNHKVIFKSANLSSIEMLLYTRQICSERIGDPTSTD